MVHHIEMFSRDATGVNGVTRVLMRNYNSYVLGEPHDIYEVLYDDDDERCA